MSRYNFRESETKWRQRWRDSRSYAAKAEPSRPKHYVLEWTKTGIEGIWRCVNRLWRMVANRIVSVVA
jgi:leucyl-tRNA synthetase